MNYDLAPYLKFRMFTNYLTTGAVTLTSNSNSLTNTQTLTLNIQYCPLSIYIKDKKFNDLIYHKLSNK